MSNLAYFEIPADDAGRAKKFYHALLGWKIEPTKMATGGMEYWDVVTGEPKDGTMNMGGMFKRQIPGTRIVTYVLVENIDKLIPKVEKLGGKIVIPRMDIPDVGIVVTIQDTEGNVIGLWESKMK